MSLTKEELACPDCKGSSISPYSTARVPCSACNGTGLRQSFSPPLEGAVVLFASEDGMVIERNEKRYVFEGEYAGDSGVMVTEIEKAGDEWAAFVKKPNDSMSLFVEPHVDDFIMDHRADRYARFMFNYWRLPAVLIHAFAPYMEGRRLFATHKGERFRVTGASRFGDVWLARDHDRVEGYDLRVRVSECSAWGPEP